MKKWLAPLALLIVLSSAALAQWQVPNYSVPLGRGPGSTGFKRAVPGTTGLPLTSNGAAADPTFRQPISTANKVFYVSTVGSDAADGLSWATPKLTIQAAVDAASNSGKVLVGVGTYTLTAPVYMRSGVALECVPGAILTQGNAANLASIVDFSGFFGGNRADNASLRHCDIDGNRPNNTGQLFTSTPPFIYLVYLGLAENVVIDQNVIHSGPGYGLQGNAPPRVRVTRNTIYDTEAAPLYFVSVDGGAVMGCIIDGNITYGIFLLGINDCVVTNNILYGTLIGDVNTPLHVNISGTAVTWVSGPTFSTAKSGMVLIANNGTVQILVKSVNSSTSLTLVSTGGTVSNTLTMIGDNDLFGLGGVKNVVVANNYLSSGASFGLSLFGIPSAKIENVIVTNNIMYKQGINGFALLGDGGGYSGIGASNITITNNQVLQSNIGGAAGCGAGGSCLYSYLIVNSTQSNILLDGNHAQDDLGNTLGWLNVTGLADGAVRVGNNNQIGATNIGIVGGIRTITLSSGWGSTASSTYTSFGNAVKFIITANGSGIGANPTITVKTVATKYSQTNSFPGGATWLCKNVGGTGVTQSVVGEQSSFIEQIGALSWAGTPVAGSTYEFICQ